MDELLHMYIAQPPSRQKLIRYAARGYTNPQLAEQLILSGNTVADYLTDIYAELEIVLACPSRPTRPVLVHQFTLLFVTYPHLIPADERADFWQYTE